MNQNLRRYFSVFLFTALLYASAVFGDQCQSTVVWNSSGASDALDANVEIDGCGGCIVLNQGGTSIKALNCDVSVTVINSDSVVKGNASAPSQLYLFAAQNRTITFNVQDYDLAFAGSADQDKDPLLVVVGGSGNVIFNFKGGRSLELSSLDGQAGGVKMYVLMDDPAYGFGSIPTLSFNRVDVQEYGQQEFLDDCDQNNSANQDIHIVVDKKSLLSYLSCNAISCAQDAAAIQFNPTNQGKGRMIVNIADKGGLIISGHKVNECTRDMVRTRINGVTRQPDGSDLDGITLESIDSTCAAGCNAIFKVVREVPYGQNGDFFAGLQIQNKNKKLFDLLIDPYFTLGARCDTPSYVDACACAYKGDFSGIQYGFVLGANGTVDIQDGAYLDYVSLANNVCPDVRHIPGHFGEKSEDIVKLVNPSAFWVDGNNNPDAKPAEIKLGDCSGLFFRSGVDKDGDICYAHDYECWGDHSFTVDSCDKTPGAGEYVFIVEGPLNVHGSNDGDCQKSKIEILSLHVNSRGGTLFNNFDCYNCQEVFPRRSFDGPDCYNGVSPLFMYNKAAFLINNDVNLYNTTLDHTDVNHLVLPKNDVRSEPTYVGGESWWLSKDFNVQTCKGLIDPCSPHDEQVDNGPCHVTCLPVCTALPHRPRIAFFNSRFNIHTDVAVTGMDLAVPNNVDCDGICLDNLSKFVFYYNGRCIDQGTGRTVILGTTVGSTACNECKIINNDAHLDVIQATECDAFGDVAQLLSLETDANDLAIDNEITCDIVGQNAIHNIFLGHDSNISIGSHASCNDLITRAACDSFFEHETFPTLLINGNFFSFNTRGGSLCLPSSSHITGKGGIFVDKNGIFSISPQYRAALNTMVTRSCNGVIILPPEQVFFGDFTGEAEWAVNLANESDRILVAPGASVSDFTFNWIAAKKDYCESCCPPFVPYELPDPTACSCPPVCEDNVTSLPTIAGDVDQFQIQGARIGDEPTILIDGGWVRELVFQRTGQSADAPVAIVVLRNNGRVGVNTAHPTPDSLFAATTFGINGLTIIADGSGRVDLNEDMIVDNHCAFLKGPNFQSSDLFEVYSDVQRSIIVRRTGILDLRSFGPGDRIQFGGQIRIILEPGARIILGGGELIFANDVVVEIDTVLDAQELFKLVDGVIPVDPIYTPYEVGFGVNNTDFFRVKIIGEGTIRLKDDAQFYIDKNAFVGIETLSEGNCEIPTTAIVLELNDNGYFSLGGDRIAQGGTLQVGNTIDQLDHTVSFSLLVQGVNAQFRMGPQAFFGLNVGIVDRQNDVPNGWLVDVLYNVTNITINLQDGLFEVANIFPGDNPDAHLFAIGEDSDLVSPQFTLIYEPDDTPAEFREFNANIHGGGNYVRINRGSGAFKPIVLTVDDVTPNPNMRVGILASLPLLPSVEIDRDLTADSFFSQTKTVEGTVDPLSRDINLGNASTETKEFSGITTELHVGYIDRGTIGRDTAFDVIDINNGTQPDRVANAADRGAVGIAVDLTLPAPAPLLRVTQLP